MSLRFDSTALCLRCSSCTAHRSAAAPNRVPCEGRVASPRSNRSRLFLQCAAFDAIFPFPGFVCVCTFTAGLEASAIISPRRIGLQLFRSRVGAAIATRPVFALAPASFGSARYLGPRGSSQWRPTVCFRPSQSVSVCGSRIGSTSSSAAVRA